ncbi:MAG TPA: cupin domain-containing protein [Chitinophagaceae bacterium]|nr:cupin domain-containing protein [Chitinophagaceae bacterium]
MKNNNMKYSTFLVYIFIIFSGSSIYSQNWEDTDPKMTNVIVDTVLIKSTIAVLEPGEKSKPHTHPAHFFYALTDGKIKIHYNDGTSVEMELKSGDYGFSNPEGLHQTENIRDKTLRFLIVELKEHPYKK